MPFLNTVLFLRYLRTNTVRQCVFNTSLIHFVFVVRITFKFFFVSHLRVSPRQIRFNILFVTKKCSFPLVAGVMSQDVLFCTVFLIWCYQIRMQQHKCLVYEITLNFFGSKKSSRRVFQSLFANSTLSKQSVPLTYIGTPNTLIKRMVTTRKNRREERCYHDDYEYRHKQHYTCDPSISALSKISCINNN